MIGEGRKSLGVVSTGSKTAKAASPIWHYISISMPNGKMLFLAPAYGVIEFIIAVQPIIFNSVAIVTGRRSRITQLPI